MKYKTETHLHTSESSPCGFMTAKEMVQAYKNAGYKTVIITDHVYEYPYRNMTDKTWDEKIDYSMTGFKNAKAHGDKIGVNVLFAIEIVCEDNDHILYGITEKLLRSTPNIYEMTMQNLKNFADKNNILVVQAHPFRTCSTTPRAHEYGFGAEVYNGQYDKRHRQCYDSAMEYAGAHGLLKTSGSDAHEPDDIARGGMISKTEIKTMDDFIELVKSGSGELITS